MPDIRFATVADIPTIQVLTDKVWPATYSGILSAEQISFMLRQMYSAAALEQQMNGEGHEFIILYNGDAPNAFASYSKQDLDTWKLHKLYILPALQGKGTGSKLMNFIVNRVKEQGAKKLLLNVNRYNPARSFYKKLGFKIVGEEDIDIGEGYFMNDYIMSLAL